MYEAFWKDVLQSGCCRFIKHVGCWVERLICPSHRGLDSISLCFPQLAQPTQCLPQDCMVSKHRSPGIRRGCSEAGDGKKKKSGKQAREEGKSLPVYVNACQSCVNVCVNGGNALRSLLVLLISSYFQRIAA